jgi:hypothetical protein
MPPKDEPWFKPRKDEDADDRMLDEKFGRGPHPGGKPPNRGCALVAVAGAGGLAALIAAAVEGVSRIA